MELTHFVTGSVIFFVVFHAFRNLYIPHPKPPFSQQVPLAAWWLSGVFPHHFIDTGASNNVGFIDSLGFKLKR